MRLLAGKQASGGARGKERDKNLRSYSGGGGRGETDQAACEQAGAHLPATHERKDLGGGAHPLVPRVAAHVGNQARQACVDGCDI
eukprot:276383-Chlamydomonas_euryale.AAC.1